MFGRPEAPTATPSDGAVPPSASATLPKAIGWKADAAIVGMIEDTSEAKASGRIVPADGGFGAFVGCVSCAIE
jgi:hypothetical protein